MIEAFGRWAHSKPSPSASPKLPINLALQGGGALGAFSWGVLDRILEDRAIEISGVSGASAGALNAVALADGMAQGGRDGARERLGALWERIGALAPHGMLARLANLAVRDAIATYASLAGPGPSAGLAQRTLRRILEETIDFERLRTAAPFPITISATRLATGSARIFSERDLTPDVLLASACLPQIFGTVTIDGEAYWDGGYAANPPLLPLMLRTKGTETWAVRLISHDPCEAQAKNDRLPLQLGRLQFSRAYLAERERFEAFRDGLSAVPAFLIRDAHARRLRGHVLREIDGAALIAKLPGIDPASPTADAIARLHGAGRAVLQTTN